MAVDWPVADSFYAVSRRRLLVRGHTIEPDPAHPRRRPVSRGNRRPLLAMLREPGYPRLQLERQLRIRWSSRREKPRGEKSEPPSIHLSRSAPRERKDCHGIGDLHSGCQSRVVTELLVLQRLTRNLNDRASADCHLVRTAVGEHWTHPEDDQERESIQSGQCTAVSIAGASFGFPFPEASMRISCLIFSLQ